MPLPAIIDDKMDINRGIAGEQVHHVYPYSTLPDLKSHLHPKFAIFDAGKKLDKLYKQDSRSNPVYGKFLEDYPNAQKTLQLYLAWIGPLPENALEDKTYYDLEEFDLINGPELQNIHDDLKFQDNDDNDSDYEEGRSKRTRTVAWRGGVGPFIVRRTQNAESEQARIRPRTRSMAGNGKGQGGEISPQKAPVKKRKVLSASFTRNQHLLSEATLSRINQQRGEAAWTAERIRQWSLGKKRRVIPSYLFV